MTPQQVIESVQKGVAICHGVARYHTQLHDQLLASNVLAPDYKRVYEMLRASLAYFRRANEQELIYLDQLWGMFGVRGQQRAADVIAMPTPICFTGEISAAGKALEDDFTWDYSLEGLGDPDRFKTWHDAVASNMTIITCMAFWHEDQMADWHRGLNDIEKEQYAEHWDLWLRAVEGGRRQVRVARACLADAAGFFWTLEKEGTATDRNTALFNHVYGYYQQFPERVMTCYDGTFALDPDSLSAGDAALRELSPFVIADSEPS